MMPAFGHGRHGSCNAQVLDAALPWRHNAEARCIHGEQSRSHTCTFIIFADEHGESHFRDIEVTWLEDGRDGSSRSATGITFRVTPSDYFNDWHNPSRRQFVINLDAPVEITASDGESRIIGAGEVLLLEDLHGKGHIGRAVAGKMRHSVLVSTD